MIRNSAHSATRMRMGFGMLLVLAVLSACSTTPDYQTEFEQDKKSRAHYNAGIELMRQGKYALGIRELRTALQISPEDPWIHWAIAEAYRRKGRFEDAEKHLLKALDLRPDFQQARLNLSALYVQLGRHQEAIAQTDVLLDDPTFPVPWKALTNRGWAEYELGNREQARKDFESALEYNEKHWRSFLALGILDVEGGDKMAALENFEQVIALDPGPLAEAEANYRIGEVYVSLGNREQALQHLTAAAAKEPNGPWGERSEDYLRRLR